MAMKVRAAGLLIENFQILLLKQKITESLSRSWSLPGGVVEFGESKALIREFHEKPVWIFLSKIYFMFAIEYKTKNT